MGAVISLNAFIASIQVIFRLFKAKKARGLLDLRHNIPTLFHEQRALNSPSILLAVTMRVANFQSAPGFAKLRIL